MCPTRATYAWKRKGWLWQKTSGRGSHMWTIGITQWKLPACRLGLKLKRGVDPLCRPWRWGCADRDASPAEQGGGDEGPEGEAGEAVQGRDSEGRHHHCPHGCRLHQRGKWDAHGFRVCWKHGWSLSGLIQVQPKNVSFPKTRDLPCFLFHVAVFIHLRSLFAACFKLCKLSFCGQNACMCGCLCVCVSVHGHACVCAWNSRYRPDCALYTFIIIII